MLHFSSLLICISFIFCYFIDAFLVEMQVFAMAVFRCDIVLLICPIGLHFLLVSVMDNSSSPMKSTFSFCFFI